MGSGASRQSELSLGCIVQDVQENECQKLAHLVSSSLLGEIDCYKQNTPFLDQLQRARCLLTQPKYKCKKVKEEDLKVRHIAISVFREGLPDDVFNELSAKKDQWVDFTECLFRNYLSEYFASEPRFHANGDVFTFKGASFKVLGMSPAFGVVSKGTDVLGIPLLVSASTILDKVEVVPLQPVVRTSADDKRLTVFKQIMAARATDETAWFREHILPLFTPRRGGQGPAGSSAPVVHTRTGEVLVAPNGMAFTVVALDKYDSRGGVVNANTTLFCGAEPLKEVKEAYFTLEISNMRRLRQWFGRAEFDNPNFGFITTFLRTFFASNPQIAIANKQILPCLTARVLRHGAPLARGLITQNTNIELQLVTTRLIIDGHPIGGAFDVLPLFHARLTAQLNQMAAADPRRDALRRIIDRELPRLHGREPMQIITEVNRMLEKIVAAKGLTSDQVDRYTTAWPYIPPQDGEVRSCPICLVEFEKDEPIRCLQCMHLFHDACIKQWLKSSYECPCCHTPVVPQRQSRHRHANNDGGDAANAGANEEIDADEVEQRRQRRAARAAAAASAAASSGRDAVDAAVDAANRDPVSLVAPPGDGDTSPSSPTLLGSHESSFAVPASPAPAAPHGAEQGADEPL